METYVHWRLIGNVPNLENTVGLRLHNFLFKQLYYSVFVTVHPDNFGNNPREKYFSEKPASCKYFSHSSGTSALEGCFINLLLLFLTLIAAYQVTGVTEGCCPNWKVTKIIMKVVCFCLEENCGAVKALGKLMKKNVLQGLFSLP